MRFLKITFRTLVLLLLAVLLTGVVVLQTPKAQTYLAQEAVARLSEKINAEISIGGVSIIFFNTFIFKDVCVVTEAPADTLFHAKKVAVRVGRSNLSEHHLHLRQVNVAHGDFRLITQNGKNNLKDLVKNPAPKDTTQKEPLDWTFSASRVTVEDFGYVMRNKKAKEDPPRSPHHIDYSQMHITQVDARIKDVTYARGTLHARLDHLEGYERSGYAFHHMEGDVTVNAQAALVEHLVYQDNFSHLNAHYFKMGYGDPDNLKDYVNLVPMELDLDNAFVSFRTISAYAGPGIKPEFTLGLYLTGLIQGPVANLHSNALHARTPGGNTELDLSFRLRGLVDVPSTTLQIDFKRLHSRVDDLDYILHSISGASSHLSQSMGATRQFAFEGRLAGLLTDFAIDGQLTGDFGFVDVDMVLNASESKQGVLMTGELRTEDLDLKAFAPSSSLESISLYTQAHATLGQQIYAAIDTLSVDHLVFNHYAFSGFKAKGELKDGFFDGRMTCADPNLNFLFQGRVALPGERRKEMSVNFFTNIAHANLYKLNLVENDSLAVFNGLITARFSRLGSLDNLAGVVRGTQLGLQNSTGHYTLNNLFLESKRIDATATDSTRYEVTLDSEALRARYSGPRGVDHFAQLLSQKLQQYLPCLSSETANPEASEPIPSEPMLTDTLDQTYALEATCFDTSFLEQLFLPGLYVAPETQLSLTLPSQGPLQLDFSSARIGYKKNHIKNFTLAAQGDTTQLQTHIDCENATFAGITLSTVAMQHTLAHNLLHSQLSFHNKGEKANHAQIFLHTQFRAPEPGKTAFYITIPESSVTVNNKPFQLDLNGIDIYQKQLQIDQLRLRHQNEYLLVDGTVSELPNDTLNIVLNRFDASFLNSFLENAPLALEGSFTGKGQLMDAYQSRRFFMDITGDSLRVNQTPAGQLRLLTAWDPKEEHIKVGIALTEPNEHRALSLRGSYRPEDQYVRVTTTLNQFKAALVGPLLSGILSQVGGTISGDILAEGPLSQLALTGTNTRVDQLAFTVDFTRVPYLLNGPVAITPNSILLHQNPITDTYGHEGVANGGIHHKHFKDVTIDLGISFNNLLALNTTERESQGFYGTAFATGNLSISGPTNNLLLDLAVRTDPQTAIHIPLSGAAQAKETGLLAFKQPPPPQVGRDPYALAELIAASEVKKASNLTLKMRTEVTPNAQVMVEINKTSGNVISGRGDGVLYITVDPKRDPFSIKGDCTLESGNYLFGLQGIISKRFQITPGSVLSFNGGVMDTRLNIEASYKTKASLSSLLYDYAEGANRREVDCRLLVSGPITSPSIGFDIEVEDVDPGTKALIETALNTEDKVMRQFMALLVSNNFIPDLESGIVNNTDILYSNASELMVNQLNNILTQLQIPLDVGFNYKLDEYGYDLFDVAVSTQLFNNRVLINGSVGNNPLNSSSQNELVGNLDVELKLGERGNFRLKAFSHAADLYSNYLDNTQRNGGGFVFQQEFNSIRDLFKKKSSRKKSKKLKNL